MKRTLQLPLICVLAGAGFALLPLQDKVTYDDTPLLPNGKYRVHGERPWPEVVTPGARPSDAPSDAVVLFDGSGFSAWKQGNKETPTWSIEDGAMVVRGGGKLQSLKEFGDCQLHVEFTSPVEVKGNSQGRGNSGVFLMGRYEIQVLDSYDNPSYPDGQCSALYGQMPPMVNACKGPGEWQAYDIIFRAPRFADGKLVEPARATVLHNGVLTHHDQALLGATTHKQVAKYSPHGPKGPIELQDHGNPVRFRNIWVRELDLSERE